MSMQSVLKSFFQFEIKTASDAEGFVYILGSTSSTNRLKDYKKLIEEHALARQIEQLKKSEKRTVSFSGQAGPVWIMQSEAKKKGQHHGLLDESNYAWFRDQSGSVMSLMKSQGLEKVIVTFIDCDEEIIRPVIIGFELGAYNFLAAYNTKPMTAMKINLQSQGKSKLDKDIVSAAQIEARAVQVARHIVNLPPNEINPETFQNVISRQFKFPKTMTISVWNQKKLEQENMNLLLATGGGSDTPPRMIHLKYRPRKKSLKQPIAFVGKGITFDTGGLDIKPSSAMRLMKKDMGGSAAVLGLAYWVAQSNYERPCDFYLALAENAVDAKSMRPSDLYRSRAGHLVEIDNTDAEGRLVLADVMDVAATKKGADEPEILVDIATLTGAIKVALGADIAGLFSNDDKLAEQMNEAGQRAGDLNWRMPLVQKYWGSLSSPFADFKNSGEGFGGAITAALFLEKFCGGKKWAHLDVYSWSDRPSGALQATGGSGQPVQAMIEWLKSVR